MALPRMGYGFPVEGGGGGFTFGPSVNTFADNAARNTYAAANPSWLAQYDANEFLVIAVGTGENQEIQQRVNDAWQVATAVMGVPGLPGIDGADGSSFFFESFASRDAFFLANNNANLLRTNLPITVNTGLEIVATYVWRGPNQASDYIANDTRWVVSSIMTAAGTIYLGGQGAVRLSSTGENAAFTNGTTGVSYHPGWQLFSEGNTLVSRVRSATETTVISDRSGVLTNPVFDLPTTIDQTVYSLEVVAVNSLTNAELIGTISGQEFFRVILGDVPAGVQTLTFSPPLDLRANTTITFSTEADQDVVLEGNESTGVPYGTLTLAAWSDSIVALNSDLSALSDSLSTVATSGSYSDLSDQPTIPAPRTDEEIFNVQADAVAAGTNITITRDDDSNTLTFSAMGNGGGTPPGAAENFYHGLSATNTPASIDLASLTAESVNTGSGQQFDIASGTATAGDFLILLVPADHDVTTIINTGTNINERPSFVRTADVRTISGDSYHSYVLGALVAGFTASYRITLA